MPAHDWSAVQAGVFHDFHQRWIGAIRDRLNEGLLPSPFYALAEQVAEASQPDVLALESADPVDHGSPPFDANGGALAVAEHPPEVAFMEELEDVRHARASDRVAIYHSSGDRVVAFLEIISPGNKSGRYQLQRLLDKLSGALDAGIHLVVVDIHRPCTWDPRGVHAAFWRLRGGDDKGVSEERPLGLSAYRASAAPACYFEPVGFGTPLPDMPLFLTSEHYVNVPLDSTYAEAWRGFPQRWKRVIDPQ